MRQLAFLCRSGAKMGFFKSSQTAARRETGAKPGLADGTAVPEMVGEVPGRA
jgi:hypothetical protein